MTVTAACDFHEVLSEVPATLKLNLRLGKSSVFCFAVMGAIIRACFSFPDANAKRIADAMQIQPVLSSDPLLGPALLQSRRAGK
jgi:hypothetical protein